MTATELQALKLNAKITLRIADNEGWTSQDGTRNLANLAIKAAEEIERLRAALEALITWYDTCDDNDEADDYMRFDSDNDDGELDTIVDNARAAIAKAEGGENER